MEVPSLNAPVVTNEVPAVLPNGVFNGDARDPVVPVNSLPSHVYSKEVLMELRKHALSQVKPKYLDSAYINAKDGVWDPEMWMSGNPAKRSEEKKTAEEKQGKPSSEKDDYCFTPQRRSFVTGCHVTPTRHAEAEVVEKEKEPAPRRGGTGRVVPREAEVVKDRREGPSVARGDAPIRAERPQTRDQRLYREKFAGKETRRPYERSVHDNDYTRSARGNGGMNDRRKYHDDTPEWFSGGPTSQHETIELKGFDDSSGNGKKKRETKVEQRAQSEEKQPEPSVEKEPVGKADEKVTIVESKSAQNSSKPPSQEKKDEFNIEDFLKMDSLSLGMGELDLGSDEKTQPSQGSRFSRWFKNEVDVKEVSGKISDFLANGEPHFGEKEDPGKSLLELLRNGKQQATRLEKVTGPMIAMNNLNSVENHTAPAALKIQPNDEFLSRHVQQQQPNLPFQVPVELQQRPDVQALIREMAVGRISRQQASQQLELIALHHFQQKQAVPAQPAVKPPSSSSLAFTPTSVMRKMTADKEKQAKLQLTNGEDHGTQSNPSPPVAAPAVSTSSATSTRLTGRTASQVQGADRVSSQLGLNAVQQPPRTEAAHMNQYQAFSQQYASNAAMTDIAMKLLEQQKQQQLLANALSVSSAQSQFKQYQRTSPLPQTNLPGSMQGRGVNMNQHGPVIGRSAYGSVSPQPPTPMNGPGFAPFMAGLNPPSSQVSRGGLNSGYMQQQQMSMRGQGQGMNSLMQQGSVPAYNGSRSPAMQLNNNPLGRWLPPELLSQAQNRLSGLTPMPSHKMMSLEELERLLATPMPH